jgi:hypothetical protein
LGCLTVLSGLGRDQYFYGYGHVSSLSVKH